MRVGIDKVRYLVNLNKEIVQQTALKNCHCKGLYSFIISEDPKIRLFIAEPGNELQQEDSPVPIHAHKYDDIFEVLYGQVIHSIYEKSSEGKLYKNYKYSRLSDEQVVYEYMGEQVLKKVREIKWHTHYMKASVLHTVQVGKGYTIWTVTEGIEDKSFDNNCYSKYDNRITDKSNMYEIVENPVEYINSIIDKL